MRVSTLLLIAPLLALACAERTEPATPAPRRAEQGAAGEVVAAKERPLVEEAAAAASVPNEPVAVDETAATIEEPAAVDDPAAEPSELPTDSLAPILPSAPEPGSPEADAELAELLEESTLTQEEFDAAFRGNKPKIDGDQFVFGAGERTRKRPVVGFGKPKITGSNVSETKILALATDHLRGFEGCLAAALVENPALDGAGTLRVSFDAKGEVSGAVVDAETVSVMAPLRECLAAVAHDWSLPAAAGASVEMQLSLRGD